MVTLSNSTLRANDSLQWERIGKSAPGRAHPRWRTDIETAEVVDLYEQGLSISILSKHFGCDRQSIMNRLDEWDIDVRPQWFYLRKNKRTAGAKNARWIGGTDQYWKRKLITERGNSCESCGYSIVVQVHHIDENRKNNSVDNLVLVCPNCHFANHHSGTHKLKKVNEKWSLCQT